MVVKAKHACRWCHRWIDATYPTLGEAFTEGRKPHWCAACLGLGLDKLNRPKGRPRKVPE